MMDISLFFEPVDREGHELNEPTDRNRLGNTIVTYLEKDKFPDLDNVEIAIFGVTEDREALENKGCGLAPDRIRDHLYLLFSHWHSLKIADLGNINKGKTIDDTYYAVKDVVAQLIKQNILPIIIGGSQDITYANYLAYEKLGKVINFVAVDPRFDIGQDEHELNSRSYLSRIILHQPNFLFNYTNLGFQSYYVDSDAITLMKNLYFETNRLGNARANLEETEPIVRNADVLSFDISAVRQSDAPGTFYTNPNGFFGEEACRICRYAGMNDKLSSIGFYEYNPKYDKNGQTASLMAQMIWYFIDGFYNRQSDYPNKESDDYIRFLVNIEEYNDEIVFLKSKKTERWWMEVQPKKTVKEKYRRHQYIPCSYDDYQNALNHEIPDRWWKLQQKFM